MKNNSDLFVGNRAEFEPIILLHGTFARDADWCKPGSDFCSELDAKLTDAGSPARCWYGIEHTFEDFKWSGENSQMARNADAFQLAMKLVSRLDANIGNIHIVAHSHAGNVVRRSLVHALYLLRGNRLASIVTIGTPFLINKEIKMRRGVFIELLGIPIALLVPALIMIFVLALPFMTPVREWLTGGGGFRSLSQSALF